MCIFAIALHFKGQPYHISKKTPGDKAENLRLCRKLEKQIGTRQIFNRLQFNKLDLRMHSNTAFNYPGKIIP
jgi:hypothetical protein